MLVANKDVQQELADALSSVFPPLKDLIDGTLEGLVSGAALTSVIGVVGLIWTVSQFYVTLDVAFSRIFSDEPERDILRRTARGFVVGRAPDRGRDRAHHPGLAVECRGRLAPRHDRGSGTRCPSC